MKQIHDRYGVIEGGDVIVGLWDIGKQHICKAVLALINKADVVLCDAAPKVLGIGSVSQARIFDLAEYALIWAKKLLHREGMLVVKVF